MPADTDSWIDFWDGQQEFPRDYFEWSARVFIERAGPVIKPGADDVVLDVGCGPGSVEALLAGRVGRIHCVDTSERYVRECRERFRRAPRIDVDLLDRTSYTDLARIARGPYTLILCNSVAQYYKDERDLAALLASARTITSRGSRCLVSDLPTSWSAVFSAATQVFEGVRSGRPLIAVDLARFALRSYGRTRAARGLLTYSRAGLESLAVELGIHAIVMTDRLTINGGRLHLLARF